MKYSLAFFLFIGNSLITEYNPDVKTTCDWFAMNIFFKFLTVVKMFGIITKQLHKNWLISARYS